MPLKEVKETDINWIKFGKVDSISFVAKDTLILGFGNHIVFVDSSRPEKKEVIYRATCELNGDGVQCLCAHRSMTCYAFAEKCRNPRIFINAYPSMDHIRIIEAVHDTIYLTLRFSEMEYLIALTGIPLYLIMIWNWKTGDLIVSQPSAFREPDQLIRVSLTAPLFVAQTTEKDNQLVLWDFSMCYKKALFFDRTIEIPSTAKPPFCYVWGYDGDLYFSDSKGDIFSINPETKNITLILPWKGDEGSCIPCLAWYKGGWVFTGPGRVQFARRKSPEGWTKLWSCVPQVPLLCLMSSPFKDVLAGWTEQHELIVFKGDHAVEPVVIKNYGSGFDFLCLIYPVGDNFVTFSKTHLRFCIWNKVTGLQIATMNWTKPGIVMDVKPNPRFPYIVVACSSGWVYMLNLYDCAYPFIMHALNLTQNRLDMIRFHPTGLEFGVANVDIGEFFLIKGGVQCPSRKTDIECPVSADRYAVTWSHSSNRHMVEEILPLRIIAIGMVFQVQGDPKMQVLGHTKLDLKIVDFAVMGEVALPNLLVLPMSHLCCRAGQNLLVYNLAVLKKTFQYVEDITLAAVLTGILPRSPTEIICIPHRSRMLYTMDISHGMILSKFVTGHQLKSYGLTFDGVNLLSFGYDGLVILRRVKTMACVTLGMPNHRLAKGVKYAVTDPYCQYILSLGEDKTLVCFAHSIHVPPQIRLEYENMLKSPQYKLMLLNPLMAAKTKARNLEKMNQEKTPGQGVVRAASREKLEKTWLEIRESEKFDQEEAHSRKEKLQVLEELTALKSKLVELLDSNYEASGIEQLPIQAFDLDKMTRRKKVEDAKAEREKEKHMQLATIKARDKVSEYIKTYCTDSTDVRGKELHGIFSPLVVESYPIKYQRTKRDKLEECWMNNRLKIEQCFRKGDYFDPWVPRTSGQGEQLLKSKPHISETNIVQIIKTKYEEDELEEQKNESDKAEKDLLWLGTSTHVFIPVNPFHYNQFEMVTFVHGYTEIKLSTIDMQNLKDWFNKQFKELYEVKERDVQSICEKNNRFRHIIRELSFFKFSSDICRTVILDPKWTPNEQPERILKVEDDELTATPYVTPSQQELLNKKAAEVERLRLLLLADDFKEKALITMMDGVLEKLWENEIKKDVPRPKCMLEKEPENYTEDDMKAIRAYEEAVRFLNSERERYRKLLEADWVKILHNVKDIGNKFDEKLAKLNLLKMKVESALGQEFLKIHRIRYSMQEKINRSRREDRLKSSILKTEKVLEDMQLDFQRLQESLAECRNVHESLQTKDRNLDKNFKKEFPDLSPLLSDQLYKLSKKRPKQLQKLALFSTLLVELGKCVVQGTKPEYMTSECLQYLKDVDALDNNVNAPTSVSDQAWDTMCRMRRIKIECELKVRACAVELGEAEATLINFQKKMKQNKEKLTQLQNEMNALKHEKMQSEQNFAIQLVMKRGLVEIEQNGKLQDFESAILVTKETLTDINSIIRKAGNQKIKAMRKAANFRKGIIFKEWEHKKLRMEIEDLQNHLSTIEKIKVTKELQSILTGRARGFTDEKGFLYLEEELNSTKEKYIRAETDVYRQIDDYNLKIDKLKKTNYDLDCRIAELNVDVNELNMQVDSEFDAKQLEGNIKRMKKVRQKSQLMQKAQDQHNEILMLQTELELLRLRTFPTLKPKT